MSENKKLRAAILGATGAVGQRFVDLLRAHPRIEITAVCASERSAGKFYCDACNWKVSADIPPRIKSMVVGKCDVEEIKSLCDLVFSGLDAAVAGEIESKCAEAGLAVFSNAKNHRYDDDVPILIPTANPEHIEIVREQSAFKRNGGFIVTNANCASTALCLALAPIHKEFGIEKVFCATLQACSGAGYPGLPSMDILDNCVPYISGEEGKLEMEPNKILGTVQKGRILEAGMRISSMVHRVPVTDGHLISVSLKLKAQVSHDAIKNVMSRHRPHVDVAKLHSCPETLIHVREEDDRPQHRLDRMQGNGMAVTVGRIRPCEIMDVRLSCLAHNTIVGAAGGSILNAELAIQRGILKGAAGHQA